MTKRRHVGQVDNLRADCQSAQPGASPAVSPAGSAVTIDTVRKIALALDNVEESTSYGTPAFKVGGALVARLHQDGCSLVVRMDFDQRAELMAADPATYFITDHYRDYPWILVSLSRVRPDALRDLLGGARRLAVGQVANLRADWQSAQPGNARPMPEKRPKSVPRRNR